MREEGKAVTDAALQAASTRFRAVMITSFSFILGILPLLLATGAGSASRRALGTAVFGGMLAATLIGVLLIPGLFVAFKYMRERLGPRRTHPASAEH